MNKFVSPIFAWLRFEAKTKERMIEIKSEVLNKLLEFGQINFES